jgi:hypothetical protein
MRDKLKLGNTNLRIFGQVQILENFYLAEQQSTRIPGLTEAGALALEELGRDLKGANRIWGQNTAEGEGASDDDPSSGGVIKVNRRPGESEWRVTVNNAVGVIGVDGLQLIVRPKIPLNHFEYLIACSIDPVALRLGSGDRGLEKGEGFLASVWIAYLDALTVTLRADLHHDYLEVNDDPPYIRGRMDVRRSSINLARGKISFPTTFDDLSVDNPINRILKAAALFVSTESTKIFLGFVNDDQFRQRVIYRLIADRAQEAVYRLMQAGELRESDLQLEVPRLAVHQKAALELAKHILSGVGRSLNVGNSKVSSFLYPTPQIVESAIRNLLNTHLGFGVSVAKASRMAAKLRFSPDLVVSVAAQKSTGLFATGDVKYRIRKEDWPRDVLQQAVVFADVFQVGQGFFIDFDLGTNRLHSKSETIDKKLFHRLSWPAGPEDIPDASAMFLVNECRRLLSPPENILAYQD